MNSLRIDMLQPADAERLRRIRLAALTEAPDAFGSTVQDALKYSAADWSQMIADLATFVAVLDGDDLGIVRGGPDEESTDAAFVLSMWVAPQARGKGVGEKLIDAVVEWARSKGFTRLLLDVADGNPPAIALYARYGFVPNGETGTLPPPRQHLTEHRRVLKL